MSNQGVTNWSLFAKCRLCDAVAGDPCYDPEGRELGRPHRGRKKLPTTDWSKWGYCPTCGSTPGAPCRMMQYSEFTAQINAKRPHKDRERAQHAV